ncbi:MAG: class I SAM-dependent methyltransferase [Cyanobacteriota bacterium]
MASLLTAHDAILLMRADPRWHSLIRDCYLTADLLENASRFEASPEWQATLELLGPGVRGGTVLDLGAGNGIASWALVQAGAQRVLALEPDPSDVVGWGAIQQLCRGLPVDVISSIAGGIPIPEQTVDAVLARQVLHHIHELPDAMREVARVMKRGAIFVATREHVVDDERQMSAFLAAHPVHQLTGGEHAHSLNAYLSALQGAGLSVSHVLGPLESIINAFPFKRSTAELSTFVHAEVNRELRRRFGCMGGWLRRRSMLARQIAISLGNEQPGRIFTLAAFKP